MCCQLNQEWIKCIWVTGGLLGWWVVGVVVCVVGGGLRGLDTKPPALQARPPSPTSDTTPQSLQPRPPNPNPYWGTYVLSPSARSKSLQTLVHVGDSLKIAQESQSQGFWRFLNDFKQIIKVFAQIAPIVANQLRVPRFARTVDREGT